MAKCKSCGKSIGFIQTATGKMMPIEPGVKTFINRDGEMIKGYEPHWTQCPHADKHRKKKK